MSEIRIATPRQIARFAGLKSTDMDYNQAIANLVKQGYKCGELPHFLVYAHLWENKLRTVIREKDRMTMAHDSGKETENLERLVNMYLTSPDIRGEQLKAGDKYEVEIVKRPK